LGIHDPVDLLLYIRHLGITVGVGTTTSGPSSVP
jgi:hypothetical protein